MIMMKKLVWKRTDEFITHEPLDAVMREIRDATALRDEVIERKLFHQKEQVQIPGARYHIYRDSL